MTADNKTSKSPKEQNFPIKTGKSYPLGATVYPEGVNFSVFSKNGHRVELCLFNDVEDAQPFQTISLDPVDNTSYYYWHVFVENLKPGTLYGYKVHGEYNPAEGHRFDGTKLLVDPYARAVVKGKNYDRQAAVRTGDNAAFAMKGVVVDPNDYDWEGDTPPSHPYSKSIIYELHVKGFTRHPSSGVDPAKRGTYAGFIEKIPYLKALGVTAVELMPVFQFDEADVHSPDLTNYWGYNPVGFFAPHTGYCQCQDPRLMVDEFRDMVKALHRAGIEVILDVVFNHTAEGNHEGPVFSFKGFENTFYYILGENKAYYKDFTGCGNTLNANHAIVRNLIMDSLRRWVLEMHVDGFRFDLAAVLSRDENGDPMSNPPILWEIEADPILSRTKLIAEAWDAAGLYELGSFIGDKWAEWNGIFRDDVRMFLRGDSGMASQFASNIVGSRNLLRKPFRDPNQSINFVTCHDGFTLNDLVSYDRKHNEANKEEGQDGVNNNYSSNYGGGEGPTDDPQIEALRLRQIKNFFTILLLSQGTPMILMGDEVRRTQNGNNNAYCQDNEISWFDWGKVDENRELLHFVQQLIEFRQNRPIFQKEKYWTLPNGEQANLTWHGAQLFNADWGKETHSIAFTLKDDEGGCLLYCMINAFWEPVDFEVPPLEDESLDWYPLIDTSKDNPEDFNPSSEKTISGPAYRLDSRTIVVLQARK
jgi:isoamylase